MPKKRLSRDESLFSIDKKAIFCYNYFDFIIKEIIMKNLFSGKTLLKRVLPLLLALLLCAGCNSGKSKTPETSENNPDPQPQPQEEQVQKLNGVSIEEYAIVYSDTDPDYSLRAAEYIKSEIKTRTGVELALNEDDQPAGAHEIVVGNTNRQISEDLDAKTENVQFAILANEASIAMEGDYFIIAAAAYFFVETYVPSQYFNSVSPKETKVHDPIQKKAKNFIFLIGDGMGFNQTLLFDQYDVATEGDLAYSDGEDIFYGYYLPYQGESRTKSASSSVTDSAAGGTALATGFKTTNGYVGKDPDGNNLQSLTELAAALGKATAVMSTEAAIGATPASFSAHAMDREATSSIQHTQTTLKNKYGTIIDCGYHNKTVEGVADIQTKITNTLNEVSKDKDGFFLMYEEAHIDKAGHSKDADATFNMIVRFNQAIGLFMEYAFYNPDTFVLITADHETGGLKKNSSGKLAYTTTAHTSANVPVFAYGYNAKAFHDRTMENVQIPITIAYMMGQKTFGDPNFYRLIAKQ